MDGALCWKMTGRNEAAGGQNGYFMIFPAIRVVQVAKG
jgi:hypothetical protein